MAESQRRLDNAVALIIVQKDVKHKYMKTKHRWLYTPLMLFAWHFKWSAVWARTSGDICVAGCSLACRGGFETASVSIGLVLVAVWSGSCQPRANHETTWIAGQVNLLSSAASTQPTWLKIALVASYDATVCLLGHIHCPEKGREAGRCCRVA